MDHYPWPIFGKNKIRLQAEFRSLYENDEAVKRVFEGLQDIVRLESTQEEFRPALEHLYQRTLDVLLALVAQNEFFPRTVGKYAREWIDSEVYRMVGFPPLTPYGQRQARLAPDNPASVTADGEPSTVFGLRRNHLQQIVAVYDALQLREKPGPDPGSSSRPPDFPDQVRKAYETALHAPNANLFIGVEDVMNAMQHRGKRTFERWLREATGQSWKPFKKLLHRWLEDSPGLTWEQFSKTLHD